MDLLKKASLFMSYEVGSGANEGLEEQVNDMRVVVGDIDLTTHKKEP